MFSISACDLDGCGSNKIKRIKEMFIEYKYFDKF